MASLVRAKRRFCPAQNEIFNDNETKFLQDTNETKEGV
jgi:hypothetical protein